MNVLAAYGGQMDRIEDQHISHTPGPWTIHADQPSKSDERDLGGYRIDGDGIEQIAYVWNRTSRYISDDPFGTDGGEADAMLIAAAPTMLAALKMVQGLDIHPSILRVVDDAVKAATRNV